MEGGVGGGGLGGVEYVTEIPSCFKQLARVVTRGFYQIEDFLLVDMLVRNVCMNEKELEELLKFDSKLLRSRLLRLKSEKVIQSRLRIETTGGDGTKVVKVDYYWINYKRLVNVIKYKLDHMRKKMETQERDSTTRATFKCTNCVSSFTDLDAGELFDSVTGNLYCTHCRQLVVEDEAAASGPKDTRLLLARFNEQMETIYELLKKAENIKLAPELLNPEPSKNFNDLSDCGRNGRGGRWSGDATRSSGGNDQTRIDVTIGDEAANRVKQEKKERPVWMIEESAFGGGDYGGNLIAASTSSASTSSAGLGEKVGPGEDIMSILLANEKKGGFAGQQDVIPGNTESDSDDEDFDNIEIPLNFSADTAAGMHIDDMDDGPMDDDDDEDSVPVITVGTERYPINQVPEVVISKMSVIEKETYVQLYQDYFQE